MRLVLGLVQDELHGADDRAGLAVLGDEQDALAARDGTSDAAPERFRAGAVERLHEADRRAAVDDIDEQRRERRSPRRGRAQGERRDGTGSRRRTSKASLPQLVRPPRPVRTPQPA